MNSPMAGGGGIIARITRGENGFCARAIGFVAIYSCTSVRDPEMNAALGKALASKALLKLRSVRTDPHPQEETCVVHRADICLSTADLPSVD